MKIRLDEGAFMPERGHATDAGIDIKAIRGGLLQPHDSRTFGTGVHVQLPENTCGQIWSRSGLNIKHDITATGLIDEGYSGEVRVKLHNHGFEPYKVEAGDKIAQLVVVPCMYVDIEIVDEIDEGERGSDGFGSTGK